MGKSRRRRGRLLTALLRVGLAVVVTMVVRSVRMLGCPMIVVTAAAVTTMRVVVCRVLVCRVLVCRVFVCRVVVVAAAAVTAMGVLVRVVVAHFFLNRRSICFFSRGIYKFLNSQKIVSSKQKSPCFFKNRGACP